MAIVIIIEIGILAGSHQTPNGTKWCSNIKMSFKQTYSTESNGANWETTCLNEDLDSRLICNITGTMSCFKCTYVSYSGYEVSHMCIELITYVFNSLVPKIH